MFSTVTIIFMSFMYFKTVFRILCPFLEVTLDGIFGESQLGCDLIVNTVIADADPPTGSSVQANSQLSLSLCVLRTEVETAGVLSSQSCSRTPEVMSGRRLAFTEDKYSLLL